MIWIWIWIKDQICLSYICYFVYVVLDTTFGRSIASPCSSNLLLHVFLVLTKRCKASLSALVVRHYTVGFNRRYVASQAIVGIYAIKTRSKG